VPQSELSFTSSAKTTENPFLVFSPLIKIYLSILALIGLTLCQYGYFLLATTPNRYVSAALLILTLATIFILFHFFSNDWLKPLGSLVAVARSLSNSEPNTNTHAGELEELSQQLVTLSKQMADATAFAHEIGEGKYQIQLQTLRSNDGLGKALSDMRYQLQKVAEEESKRNWTVNGIAKFSEVMREKQQSSVVDLSDAYIRHLVKYLNANQGGIYLLNEEVHSAPLIELVACYAYEKKKYEQKSIQLGQGLVGQCFLEKEYIYMTEVPEGYVKVTSGLGEATPRNILLVPIKTSEKVHGVIEIASFYPIEIHQIEFVKTIGEGFASIITGVKINSHTQKLLDESRHIANELREKEDVLRQNTEELVATQDELAQKVVEIEKESVLTTSIVDAINKTNASLELDMEGRIIGVNDIYLSLMEYSEEEIIGKMEKTLVAEDEVTSNRYDMMWNSIQTGAFNSGEYRRVSKSGRELWLTGTYSPIFDINGQPYKIIQFAQFTTEQKEKELELGSKIHAINQCMPMIEISLQGLVITANAFFMNEFGYKRQDIRNKELTSLLDPNFVASEGYTEIWRTIKTGEVITRPLKFKTKLGEDRYFISNFSPTKNLSGQVHKILLALIDITEQHRLKEHLKLLLTDEKRKNALLEMQAETTDEFVEKFGEIVLQLEENQDQVAIDELLKNKNIPILELDQQGKILLMNNAVLKILGHDAVELMGSKIQELIHFNTEEEVQHFRKMLITPKLTQMKIRFKVKEDEIITFNLFINPRFNFSQKSDYFTMLLLMMNVEPELT
jgi:PAS domain S-box-containing protein